MICTALRINVLQHVTGMHDTEFSQFVKTMCAMVWECSSPCECTVICAELCK